MNDSRDRLRGLFYRVEDYLSSKGLVEPRRDVQDSWRVHAFYNLFQPSNSRIIHVIGFPDSTTETQADVYARILDRRQAELIRGVGGLYIEDTHPTVVGLPFKESLRVSYDPTILGKILEATLSS